MTVKVFLQFGQQNCTQKVNVSGEIAFQPAPSRASRRWLFWFLPVSLVVLLLMLFSVWMSVRRYTSRTRKLIQSDHDREVVDKEMKYVKVHKKAFLEYQTAVNAFPYMGSLTHRHLLSFDKYMELVMGIKFDTNIQEGKTDRMFEAMLLDKNKLVGWIDRIEKTSSSKQRSTIGSLLTVVLFQHPQYFLEIIVILMKRSIIGMMKSGEERTFFRRSEGIIEKLVGNWISLCMYHNLKNGEIGRRFFNLYRAIKCKLDLGLIDCVSKKAKYALSFDHLMYGDIDYEELIIQVSVDIELELRERPTEKVRIQIQNIDVSVLNLDSISQVKGKIFDRALMVFGEQERSSSGDNNSSSNGTSLCLPANYRLCLHLVNATMQIMLDDIDCTTAKASQTTVAGPMGSSGGQSSAGDGPLNWTYVNTMKHYNMKSGNKFLLATVVVTESLKTSTSGDINLIHLEVPEDSTTRRPQKASNKMQTKQPVQVAPNEINKEAYLMILMATKKSLHPFIEGFFQYLTNWRGGDDIKLGMGTSSNSLFESQFTDDSQHQQQQSEPLLTSQQQQTVHQQQEQYTMPVYFLFGIFDDIGRQLQVQDAAAISLWKSNSFILRFWINMIKNPDFIFAIDKDDAMDGSLTTIATVLIESCSVASNIPINVDHTIIKQLFYEEVKSKYSKWWRSFMESAKPVTEQSMLLLMKDINENSNIYKHYNSAIKDLRSITAKLCPDISNPPDLLTV